MLLDEAIGASGLSRYQDVVLGRGAAFDTLAARLAEALDGTLVVTRERKETRVQVDLPVSGG